MVINFKCKLTAIKTVLIRVIDFILCSNIFIAICSVCYLSQGYLLTGNELKWDALTVLTFFSTLFTYLLIRLAAKKRIEKYKRNSRWIFFLNSIKLMQGMAAASFLICVITFFFLKSEVQLALIVPGIISVLYGVPLFKYRNKPVRMRDVGLLKIFLISFVWAYTGSVLPVINSGGEVFASGSFILFAACFLFIFSITIPFDLRDVEIDAQSNIKTIPSMMGSDFSVRLALACLFMSAGLHIYLQQFYKLPQVDLSMPVTLSIILTGFLIIKMKHETNERLYLGVLDGVIILQFICIFIAVARNS